LRTKELIIALQASGNYVAGGDTVNFTLLTAPLGMSDALVGYPGTITDFRVISAPAGYEGKLIKGTTLANWKLKVLQGGAAVSNPLAEIPAAAYPGGVTGDVFVISITGPKLRI